VQFLIELGSDIDLQNTYGFFALQLAALRGLKEVVKILLGHGAKLDLQDQFGMTALHEAAEKGFEEIVKILIEHGSNIDLQDYEGKTPLHCAAEKGFKGIVKILIEHGSNIQLQDKDGKTAVDIAKDQNIVKLIIQLKGKTIKPARKKRKLNPESWDEGENCLKNKFTTHTRKRETSLSNRREREMGILSKSEPPSRGDCFLKKEHIFWLDFLIGT